jgi:hypothetical protein
MQGRTKGTPRIFGIRTRYVFGFGGGLAYMLVGVVYGAINGMSPLALLLFVVIVALVAPIGVFGTSWLIDRFSADGSKEKETEIGNPR